MSDEIFSGRSRLEITVYYKLNKSKNGNLSIKILSEDQARKLQADDKTKDEVKSFKTEWRKPSWGQQNQVIQASTIWNSHKNENEFNGVKYRDARLKTYLVSWNIKNDKNVDVPLTSEAIDNLDEKLVSELIKQFDELTSVDSEEIEKN